MSTQTIAVEFKPKYPTAQKMVPLFFLALVVLLDQLTKILVVRTVPLDGIGAEFFGGFLRIIHVANPGIAFSIGHGWSFAARGILFRIVPLFVLVAVVVAYCTTDSLTALQRWAVCGICGGGFGNLIDRFFRKEGVVDFIDVWFPERLIASGRWPTFNVADACVVVCGILLLISFLASSRSEEGARK